MFLINLAVVLYLLVVTGWFADVVFVLMFMLFVLFGGGGSACCFVCVWEGSLCLLFSRLFSLQAPCSLLSL